MSFEDQGAYGRTGGLDYAPCHYGASKVQFRGPKRPLNGRYIACLGGTETYGKFVPQAYPALLEAQTGLRAVNLGCVNAGPGLFANDPTLVDAAARATVTVVQVMGAQNMSNRFYAVHPRRNDRFLRPSAMMQALFPEVDFTEFHFTRHMLSTLQTTAPEKFGLVTEELKEAWIARMRQLLIAVRKPSVLLWLCPPQARSGAEPVLRTGTGPPDLGEMAMGMIAGAGGSAGLSRRQTAGLRAGMGGVPSEIGPDPWLIDQAMIDAVRGEASELVTLDPSPTGGTGGMVFDPQEEGAATGVPGPDVHAQMAAALAPVVQRHAGYERDRKTSAGQ
ncbi:MAG: DUF6473 family protein [Celeribacter sp.]|jgi:hypothetical protein